MTSYRPAVEPTQKWSEMSQGQQRAAKDRYGSRSDYMNRKQAATGGGGGMPPRENPSFTPPSFGGGGKPYPMPEMVDRPTVMPPREPISGGGNRPGRKPPKWEGGRPAPGTRPMPEFPPSFGGGAVTRPGVEPTPYRPRPGKSGSINDYIYRNPEKDPNIYRPSPNKPPAGERPAPESPQFGGRIGQKPGMVGTADFQDSDGDGTDDRNQRRAGGRDVVKKRQERDQRRSQRNDKARKKAVNLRESYKGAIKKKLKKNKASRR